MEERDNPFAEEEKDYGEPGEDTRVVMMEVRRKNRKGRILFFLGAVLVVGAFAAYAIVVTPDETDDKTVALMRGIAWSGSKPTKVKNPGAKTARVHISMSRKAPVSIDGSILGEVQHYIAEFNPGVHHVDVTVGDKIMRQVMKVKAGEEFRVYFDLSEKKVEVSPVE